MLKIIAIGDVHFKCSNIPEVDLFIYKITELVKEKKPDIIVIMGDVLDTHERIHTIPLNKAYEFIDNMRIHTKVYILVGNHDMCSNQEFLTENHWMNGLKKWNNVTIVDTVLDVEVEGLKFIFCPYVSNGRFEEALNTNDFYINNKNDINIIFAHQEFRGCKMGAIDSIDGDIWNILSPHVVSGHIHSKQSPQSNIYYTGSAMQHAFGESENNTIPLFTYTGVNTLPNGKYILEELDLQLPKKYIIYMDVEDLNNYVYVKSENKIRITLSGLFEQFKAIKKTQKYKDLITVCGVKINFNQRKIINTDIDIEITKLNSFNEILSDLIKKQNDLYLTEIYNIISK